METCDGGLEPRVKTLFQLGSLKLLKVLTLNQNYDSFSPLLVPQNSQDEQVSTENKIPHVSLIPFQQVQRFQLFFQFMPSFML